MTAVSETNTVHPSRAAADDAFSLEDLGAFEGSAGDHSVDAWLETIWGIRIGESSPVSQPLTDVLEAGIATWLHRLWGLTPLPQPAAGGGGAGHDTPAD